MSSRRVLVSLALAALISVSVLSSGAQNVSIADLLLKDEFQQAEALIQKEPKTAQNVAYLGEIEFRKGHFDQAAVLYQEALKMDSKNARAHFGLGKLASTRMKVKQAVQEFKRAIELDPKVALYHFYLSDASGLEKNYS